MIDLTETKKIKQLLKENPEQMETIIENTALAICITDENGNYTAVNENYGLLYGYTKEELRGKSFLTVVPEDKQDLLNRTHDSFLKNKDEILRAWEVKKKDGKVFKIWADAGFNDQIHGKPHKITFVQPVDEEDALKLKKNFEQKTF